MNNIFPSNKGVNFKEYDLAEALEEGLTFIKENKFEKAEILYRSILQTDSKIIEAHHNLAITLQYLNRSEEALVHYSQTIKLKPDHALAHTNFGVSLENIQRFEEAIEKHKQAIALDQNCAEAYNNLGTTFVKLYRLEEAEQNFKKAMLLTPNYIRAYSNLSDVLVLLEKYEEAVSVCSYILEMDNKNIVTKRRLLVILNYFLPQKKSTNSIIIVNEDIKKIKNTFTLEGGINNLDLANLLKKSNKTIKDKIKDNVEELIFHKTQIYRRNTIDYSLYKHKEVFNKIDIIPKFNFSHFKIVIEPENVLGLCKLFFIFDKLILPENNLKRCMVEIRPKVSGTYKGLIYCSSVEEANKILEMITPIINGLIKAKIKIENRPDDKDKKKREEEIWKISKANIFKSTNCKYSLSGLSISDVTIINNWLNYAKLINDLTYKKINEELPSSKYISLLLSGQIDIRKMEFWSK